MLVIVMFVSRASANAFLLDSPIPFKKERDQTTIIETYSHKLSLRSNSESDELIFNASDNVVAPESLILFKMERD